MRQKLRSHLTFANVVSMVALFFALGVGAYAANTIDSSDVIDESLLSQDILGKAGTSTTAAVNGTLTGADISGQPANAALGQPFVQGSLTTSDIKNGTLGAADLANSAVTPEKLGTIPAARAHKTSGQTVANNTNTMISFAAEDFDTASVHDNTTNNYRLTAPIDGIYQVSGGISWVGNTSGHRTVEIRSSATISFAASNDAPGTPFVTPQSASTLVNLIAGDYVWVQGYQNSGDSLVVHPDDRTHLAMHWVGPR
jgi:hypothetical protein